MAYTFEELKAKTLAELQDIAKTVEHHEAVQGHSQMNKAHLLPALCKALNVDTHEHHVVAGIDKVSIKSRMRELKQKRSAALQAGDGKALKSIRREMHHLNHQIRAHVSIGH
jgi:folylpolyglutamate synthase/dihydropteroate synthase